MKVGFFYFLPVERKLVVDEEGGKLRLNAIDERFGLGYVFHDRLKVPDETIHHQAPGPDGGMGTYLYSRPFGEQDVPNFTYSKETQVWLRHRNFWIGRDVARVCPGPDELKRMAYLAGNPITDQFDRQWMIPTIRARDPSRYSFPTELCFNEDGEVYARRRSKDERLWELSGVLQNHIQGVVPITDSDVLKFTVEIMASYYRIGPAELTLLTQANMNPFDTSFIALTLAAIVDWQIYSEFVEKKTETSPDPPDSPSALHGAQEDEPITSPAAAS